MQYSPDGHLPGLLKTLMRHPIWVMNMLSLHNWSGVFNSSEDFEERLIVMLSWCSNIDEWLNETRVKGNPDAEALARVLFKVFRRFGDWSKLSPPFGALGSIVQVDCRLRGLCA